MKKLIILTLSLMSTTVFAGDEPVDPRRILTLNEMQRNHVLTEMRALLTGTQSILAALAKDDMKTVAEVAKPLGMGMAHNAENHLQGVLPKEFMALGMSVHKAFDNIAADAVSVHDVKHTLQQLNHTMEQCTACHASYQIRSMADKK